MQCTHCQTEITNHTHGQLYCGPRCKQLAKYKRQKCHQCTCKVCGKAFMSYDPKAIACSAQCSGMFGGQKVKVLKTCKRCGQQYVKRNSPYCSEECSRTPDMLTCVGCGCSYVGRTSVYCSQRCRLKCNPDLRTANNERSKARSGMRQDLLLSLIAERDGWDCHICGKPIDPTLSRRDMMRGSVDHVVPLTKGGTNDAANVRLSHRLCNIAKGNRNKN